MLNFCKIFIHKFVYYTALIILFDFFQRISHDFKNKKNKLWFGIAKIISLSPPTKTVRLNTIMLMFIKYYHAIVIYFTIKYNISFPPKSQQAIGTNWEIFARVLAYLFLQQVPVSSNLCKSAFFQPTVWEVHSRYRVRV